MRTTSLLTCFMALSLASAPAAPSGPDGLAWSFTRQYGQIEVGGPYAGAEFHESRPLPSRISFYYPVANSIDISTDYWKRQESRPLVIGLRINDGPKQWVGKSPWNYTVSPHRVRFEQNEREVGQSLTYEFFKNAQGMALRYVVRNRSDHPIHVEVYTHLRLLLRTCQTYSRVDSAWTELDTLTHALIAHYDRVDANRPAVFVQNLGMLPDFVTSDARNLAVADSGWSRWIEDDLDESLMLPEDDPGPAVAAFVYRRMIASRDSMVIVQAMVSTRQTEATSVAGKLVRGWTGDLTAMDRSVQESIALGSGLRSGDRNIDLTSTYALGILGTNAHYLDSAIVPMPCPAEYNFFFTHDVLLTDLHAIHFTPERVRKDLQYIASHAKDSIIPHAYYWRDGAYVTEWATPDNWNHLWFIQVVAAYLRHTGDTATVGALMPLVRKSLSEVLTQKRDDNIMYAFRPDWWDIGHVEGPRSYMTILTIRAMRDYVFMGAMMRHESRELLQYEETARAMQQALVDRLWDETNGYLTNYNGDQQDEHYYMGSLLAPVFGLLDTAKAARLTETATRYLFEPKVGVRTVWPVDFNTDSVRAFFKFVGNEAGDPYVYANGGVWPHCNAWYVMALLACGRPSDAYRVYKTVMTLPGVINSPNGQPAMYEYRNSNPSSADFGKIDKPSFLWAAGFYLGTLYRLLGVEDNSWNLTVGGKIPPLLASSEYPLVYGKRKRVAQNGAAEGISAILVDGVPLPSRCLPRSVRNAVRIAVTRGKVGSPYLESVNAVVDSVAFVRGRNVLRIALRSFEGHETETVVRSPRAPRSITLDGKAVSRSIRTRLSDQTYQTTVRHKGGRKIQILELSY